MILMPLVMLLPVIGLPIFWILPFADALPIYLFLAFLFAGMMWVMHRTMKYPRLTGADPLIGKTAEVVSRTSLGYVPPYMIRILGELWSSDSEDSLQPGDEVRIVSVQGNRVLVKRMTGKGSLADSRPEQPHSADAGRNQPARLIE